MKIASDITSLAKGLVPSVNMWQKKIRGIIRRLELQKGIRKAKFKEKNLKSLEAPKDADNNDKYLHFNFNLNILFDIEKKKKKKKKVIIKL